MSQASELRQQTSEQRRSTLLDLRKEAFNLRFRKETGQLENTARITQIRRQIARLLTVETDESRKSGPNRSPGRQSMRDASPRRKETSRATPQATPRDNLDRSPAPGYDHADVIQRRAASNQINRGLGLDKTRLPDRRKALEPSKELVELLQSRAALHSMATSTRLSALRSLLELRAGVSHGRLPTDSHTQNAVSSLPDLFHEALLDADPDVSWVAACALLLPNDELRSAITTTELSTDLRERLFAGVQEYTKQTAMGLIVSFTCSSPETTDADGPRLVCVQVEVSNELSIEHGGERVRTALPDWATPGMELELTLDVAASRSEWRVMEENSVQSTRGLAKAFTIGQLVTGRRSQPDDEVLFIDPFLNGNLLPRRSIRLAEVPSVTTVSAKAVPSRGY